MKIHVHVGVHKTATTFIQGRLKGNLAELNRAGIGYMPLWAFRHSHWHDLQKLSPETFRIEDHLDDFFTRGKPQEVRGLIISDENLLGMCGAMLRNGAIYAGVRPRLAHLRKLLAGHEVTLFCAVRRYDAFLASAYCEGLRTNIRYISFEDFTGRVNWKRMSWVALLSKFEEALQPDKTCLWRYEQFRENAESVIRALAFGQHVRDKSEESDKTAYPSFSQAAVDALESVSERLGRAVAAKLVRPVADALPKGEEFPEFNPWGPEDKTRLARRYEEDCRMIPAEKWLLPLAQAGRANAA